MPEKSSGVFGSHSLYTGKRIVIGAGPYRHEWEVIVASDQRIIFKRHVPDSRSKASGASLLCRS